MSRREERSADARVRRLEVSELADACGLLARAFAHDPFIGHFFGAPRRRRLALPPFFRTVLSELADSEALFAAEAATGRLVGVAAWLPPTPAEPSARASRHARLASIEVRALFPYCAPRLRRGFQVLGAHHPNIPHWYLAFVGVEPTEQRHGLGRALLSPVLQQADQDSVACYLETPFPETRAFYHQLGFEETAELHPTEGAPPIWTMTRPAARRA